MDKERRKIAPPLRGLTQHYLAALAAGYEPQDLMDVLASVTPGNASIKITYSIKVKGIR